MLSAQFPNGKIGLLLNPSGLHITSNLKLKTEPTYSIVHRLNNLNYARQCDFLKNGKWIVYVKKDGEISKKQIFTNETEAVQYQESLVKSLKDIGDIPKETVLKDGSVKKYEINAKLVTISAFNLKSKRWEPYDNLPAAEAKLREQCSLIHPSLYDNVKSIFIKQEHTRFMLKEVIYIKHVAHNLKLKYILVKQKIDGSIRYYNGSKFTKKYNEAKLYKEVDPQKMLDVKTVVEPDNNGTEQKYYLSVYV